MKLSNRTDYALRALLVISYEHSEGKLISAKEISEREDISLKYLEQVLSVLKMSGFITSHQGINGGYKLSRQPEEITFGEVIRAIEGTVTPLEPVAENQEIEENEPWHKRFWAVMNKLNVAITDVVDKTTLADVCR